MSDVPSESKTVETTTEEINLSFDLQHVVTPALVTATINNILPQVKELHKKDIIETSRTVMWMFWENLCNAVFKPDVLNDTCVITPSELLKIQKQGSEARAHDINQFANPYYTSDLMPAVTGEHVHEWAKKVQAWADGWALEDAVRS